MKRYVVFREYLGLDVFYVQAANPSEAAGRIVPDPPGIEIVDWGGDYAPYLTAQVRDVSLRALPIRRFPPGVWVIQRPNGEHRNIGRRGEPTIRWRGPEG